MKNNSNYQICTRCVMDTTDPDIVFDEDGVCNHCHTFDREFLPYWFPNDIGEKKLDKIIEEIQSVKKESEYDAIIGLSGGIDSSYLAFMLRKKYPNLKLLAVHVDGGWNSELAVANIENIVKKLDIDLHTVVIDWEEMKDLQKAFLFSGLFNQDVPQDHAFFASLYKVANAHKIRYFISGANIATESILPKKWGSNAMDSIQLKDIHKKFGSIKLRTFPIAGFSERYIINPYIRKLKTIPALNYMPYNPKNAKKIIAKELDWKDYGGKHHESHFTKFFQLYYLPTKFGFEKKRAHIASLIVSGLIDREEGLNELNRPLIDDKELENNIAFVLKKLSITPKEFEEILSTPNKFYGSYKNELLQRKLLFKMIAFLIWFRNRTKALLYKLAQQK